MASQSSIVWEFQADIPGMFAPYSDKVSNHIEDQYTQDPTAKVMLGQADPVLKDFTVELSNMMQTSTQRASQRQVRRKLYDNTSTIGTGIVWEWLTDVGWITYDFDTLNAIEDAFTRSEDEIDLEQLPFGLPNVVLIQKGYQKNKYSNFVRPIQRRATNYKSTSPPSSSNSPSKSSSLGSTVPSSGAKPVRKRANQNASAMPFQNPLPNSHVTNQSSSNSASRKSHPHPNRRGNKSGAHVNRQHRGQTHPNSAGSSQGSSSSIARGSVIKPPPPRNQNGIDIMKYCDFATDVPMDDCSICLIPLKDSDDENANDDDDNDDDDGYKSKPMGESDPVVQLKKCKHLYHKSCMEAYCRQGLQNGCIQCPVCKTIHGVKTGNQPPGQMDVSIDRQYSVAGYEGDGMITITYTIHSGMQGAGHPNPNTPYTAVGFPRVAYLPANDKGKKVLKLLEIAWHRKLIFTIATSTTTGIENSVVWNEIHHKTSPRDNGSGHGFPDPTYLDNVIDELKQHGVVDDDDPS